MFVTLYANEKGKLLDYPGSGMLGQTGQEWVIPEENEMMLLPKGATLITMPYSMPVGINAAGELICIEEDPITAGRKVYAAAALLPQGFTRTLMPASIKRLQKQIPLFGYAAVGFKNGQIYVAAVKTDEHKKWHPVNYNTRRLPMRIEKMVKLYPDNRILRQLAHCSLEYNCYTAQNIFYSRWEGGIPTIGECNAGCIACISESHGDAESPQNRIKFRPTIKEISAIASHHLANAKEPIISFGQGCEGEPSLNARDLSQAIIQTRRITDKGTINMNTNAGYTKGIKLMCDSGLDAMRVTVFSFVEENYDFYHRPRGYKFADVWESVTYAKDKGLRVSVNLLTFPGFTDQEAEITHLLELVRKHKIDMIQLRNLNINPQQLKPLSQNDQKPFGIPSFINILKAELPEVEIGSYTHFQVKSPTKES